MTFKGCVWGLGEPPRWQMGLDGLSHQSDTTRKKKTNDSNDLTCLPLVKETNNKGSLPSSPR